MPNSSQLQEISQTVGDTKVNIVYHRLNVKAREVWGKLVPFDEIWRTGANENTTFEVTNDVTINGQNYILQKPNALAVILHKKTMTILLVSIDIDVL